ncbi:DUF1311 domain-containing protein [Actinomadura logoneensis]|uniref:DUF1311 domain-containing protein n=1 Tax=Actinomadura logoneensis TaxID=2293572 RepID=A0A372JN82_9ACTN|nr:DUF1311 domain-containing protein [Actinomadura logoneensis]
MARTRCVSSPRSPAGRRVNARCRVVRAPRAVAVGAAAGVRLRRRWDSDVAAWRDHRDAQCTFRRSRSD